MQALHGWLSTVHLPRLVRGIFKSFLSYNRKECVKYFFYLLKSSPGPREPIRGTSVYHVTHLNTNLSYRRKGVHSWHSVEASINWGSITSRENNKCVIINGVVMMDMDYPVPEEFLKTWQASVKELEREASIHSKRGNRIHKVRDLSWYL